MDKACPMGQELIHRMNTSTWKCPACGATNPAPTARRETVSCAACAASFTPEYTVEVQQAPPVLVEKTSKVYKRQQVICYLLILSSFGGCVVGGAAQSGLLIGGGLLTFVVGAIWLLLVRGAIWWDHG